ncbi:hypothetical protein SAMN02745181_3086 [Rubritalea squalenifaciens DSM 18772]|uniref:Uncharacterized protein n=2 Tax=Rubritalea TaxID=361050 RepID=A0A1M6P686_9BACT|nr:hypothetical protein [Rubritalea squalenifaciens]SHK03435.1 hypothetical protein SAMN02745181_3086 [Rubritalea squalenifaciens DSM 18772]
MEPNLRDTPLRRFNTFWWGLALFVVFALVAFILRGIDSDEMSTAETERGKERTAILEKVTAEQLAERDTYKELGDGKVQVKPTQVFGLAKEMGLLEEPKASEAKHNMKFK